MSNTTTPGSGVFALFQQQTKNETLQNWRFLFFWKSHFKPLCNRPWWMGAEDPYGPTYGFTFSIPFCLVSGALAPNRVSEASFTHPRSNEEVNSPWCHVGAEDPYGSTYSFTFSHPFLSCFGRSSAESCCFASFTHPRSNEEPHVSTQWFGHWGKSDLSLLAPKPVFFFFFFFFLCCFFFCKKSGKDRSATILEQMSCWVLPCFLLWLRLIRATLILKD